MFTMLSVVLLVGVKYSLDQSNLRNVVLETIRTGLAPEQLIEFTFSKEEIADLNWKKDHEFELDGEMYDIVSTSINGNEVSYNCFHDTKESKYKRQFYKWIGNWLLPERDNSDKNEKNGKSSKTYYCKVINNLDQLGSLNKLKVTNTFYLCDYSRLTSGPNAPPPKF